MWKFLRLRGFSKSEDGTLLVIWGVSFSVLFGIVALSFDLGRVASTRSEMQSFADSVALAAAAELDGRADSITRASAAANELISDTQTFATGAQALVGASNYTISFYETLPSSDVASMSSGATSTGADAQFVRVDMNTRNVGMTFNAAFAALSGLAEANGDVDASAVAGYTGLACDITPLMFCLPNSGYTAAGNVGNTIIMRAGGNGAAWGPGNFGFLDLSGASAGVDPSGPCAGLSGTGPLIRCLVGAEGNITRCFAQRGVNTEPGQKVGIQDSAFNVRFDMYTGAMSSRRNDADYAPAPNVIKGIVRSGGGGGGGNGNSGGGNVCIGNNSATSPDTLGLPKDDCFAAGTCTRFGDGDWTAGRAAYVATNYGGVDPHPTATTRYDYYLAEIAAAGGGSSSTAILPAGLSETGRPQCSANQSSDPLRRVVVAAGIDCGVNPVAGAATNIPVEEYFEVFLTEPVGDDGSTTPPTLDLVVEVIGSAGSGGGGTGVAGGVFRELVQLYR